MTITIQPQLPVIIALTIIIVISLKLISIKLNKFDPLSKPKGIVLLLIMAVDFLSNLIHGAIKDKKIADKLIPYFLTVIIYIFFVHLFSLLDCLKSF